MVAEKLGYQCLDGGSFFRSVAKKNHITLEELRVLRMQSSKWNHEIDDHIKELGEKEDNLTISGRTAWHLIPHSLKIYLKVDEEEGSERIYNELQKNPARNIEEGKMDSLEDIIKSQRKRKEEDIQIYKKHYGVDIHDPKNYDFILDTTGLSIEEVFGKVMEFIESRNIMSRTNSNKV